MLSYKQREFFNIPKPDVNHSDILTTAFDIIDNAQSWNEQWERSFIKVLILHILNIVLGSIPSSSYLKLYLTSTSPRLLVFDKLVFYQSNSKVVMDWKKQTKEQTNKTSVPLFSVGISWEPGIKMSSYTYNRKT